MDIQVTFTWLRKLLGSAMVLDQYASILLSACFLYSICVVLRINTEYASIHHKINLEAVLRTTKI